MQHLLWMTIPGLTTRETAIVAWALLFFAHMLARFDNIRNSARSVVQSVLAKWIVLPTIAAALYTAAVTWWLYHVGYWEIAYVKTTVLWYFGTALRNAFTTNTLTASELRKVVFETLAISAFVAYVVAAFTFPLPVELLLVPVSVVLVMLKAVADIKEKYARARPIFHFFLGLIGLAVLAYSAVQFANHFSNAATVDNLRDVLLPFILTLCFLPYLYALRLFAALQMAMLFPSVALRDNPGLLKFAKRQIFWACRFNLKRTQDFADGYSRRFFDGVNEADILEIIRAFQSDKTR